MQSRIRLLLALSIALMSALPLIRSAEGPAPLKRVALVFDDGPQPENAEPLLALLAREKIHVTFSYVADRAEKAPETAKAALAAGHEVANHSQTHAHARTLDDALLEKEIGGAQKSLTALLGRAPVWYWPPFLEVDARVKAGVARAQLAIYTPHHLVVSKDYDAGVPADEIRRLATTDVRDGSVILFHEWRRETREQLPAILAELRRQGCEFYTFSELRKSLDARAP